MQVKLFDPDGLPMTYIDARLLWVCLRVIC